MTRFAGIDVSKAHLDVALRPDGIAWRSVNTDSGVREVADRLKELHADLVVLEATGGLEDPVAGALAVLGVPIAVVNPRQVRDFAKSVGRLATTDTLDAMVLAHFAEAVKPEPHPLPDEQARQLSPCSKETIERDVDCRAEPSSERLQYSAKTVEGPHQVA